MYRVTRPDTYVGDRAQNVFLTKSTVKKKKKKGDQNQETQISETRKRKKI